MEQILRKETTVLSRDSPLPLALYYLSQGALQLDYLPAMAPLMVFVVSLSQSKGYCRQRLRVCSVR